MIGKYFAAVLLTIYRQKQFLLVFADYLLLNPYSLFCYLFIWYDFLMGKLK
jgi:hypothetical protein